MDPKIDSIKDDLPPGGQTVFSSVFGAIGNYAMVGMAVAWSGHKLFKLANKTASENVPIQLTVGVTTVGAVLGAIHGLVEAKNIKRYREAVADTIDGLNRELKTDKVKINELYKQVQDHAQEQGRAA
jgi:hypothetical protein